MASYKHHFATYNTSKKHVVQLIPNTVWKSINQAYLKTCLKPQFVENTLKDHIQETLKELKTTDSNENGSKQATLQCDGFGMIEIH